MTVTVSSRRERGQCVWCEGSRISDGSKGSRHRKLARDFIRQNNTGSPAAEAVEETATESFEVFNGFNLQQSLAAFLIGRGYEHRWAQSGSMPASPLSIISSVGGSRAAGPWRSMTLSGLTPTALGPSRSLPCACTARASRPSTALDGGPRNDASTIEIGEQQLRRVHAVQLDGAGAHLADCHSRNFVAGQPLSIAQHPQQRRVVGRSTLTSCRSG